ncbi:MAG: hypothetical protein ACRCYF_04305, partial [Shewanella sp.]
MQDCQRYLTILILLLIAPLKLAAEEKTQVDQIFALFDSGEAVPRETIEQNLALLEKLISSDDS